MAERNMTLPLGGSGCIGTISLTGSKENVEAMMAKLNVIIRNELHISNIDKRIPMNTKPAPCAGCGN